MVVKTQIFLQKSEINVYTDGSKTEEGVGSGYAIYRGSKKIHVCSIPLSENNSVFQAEMNALLEAGKKILTRNEQNKVYKMFQRQPSKLASSPLEDDDIQTSL